MSMTRSQLNIRVDSKLHSAIQASAKSDHYPLIDWVTNALLFALSAETPRGDSYLIFSAKKPVSEPKVEGAERANCTGIKKFNNK